MILIDDLLFSNLKKKESIKYKKTNQCLRLKTCQNNKILLKLGLLFIDYSLLNFNSIVRR